MRNIHWYTGIRTIGYTLAVGFILICVPLLYIGILEVVSFVIYMAAVVVYELQRSMSPERI